MTRTDQTSLGAPVASPEVPAAPATMPPVLKSAAALILGVATLAAGFIMTAAVVLAWGEDAKTKMEFFRAGAWFVSIVFAVALGALGFSVGKLLEGVVPAGAGPALLGMIRRAPGVSDAEMAELQPRLTSLAAPPAPETTPGYQRGGYARIAPVLLIALLSFACAGTSEIFKRTAPVGVNLIVKEMRQYTAGADWDRNHDGTVSTAEASAKLAELAETEKLASSVRDKKRMTLTGVETAWRPVEPKYTAYVQNDPKLPTAEDKQILMDTAAELNNLIEKEKARQRAALGAFSASP